MHNDFTENYVHSIKIIPPEKAVEIKTLPNTTHKITIN